MLDRKAASVPRYTLPPKLAALHPNATWVAESKVMLKAYDDLTGCCRPSKLWLQNVRIDLDDVPILKLSTVDENALRRYQG